MNVAALAERKWQPLYFNKASSRRISRRPVNLNEGTFSRLDTTSLLNPKSRYEALKSEILATVKTASGAEIHLIVNSAPYSDLPHYMIILGKGNSHQNPICPHLVDQEIGSAITQILGKLHCLLKELYPNTKIDLGLNMAPEAALMKSKDPGQSWPTIHIQIFPRSEATEAKEIDHLTLSQQSCILGSPLLFGFAEDLSEQLLNPIYDNKLFKGIVITERGLEIRLQKPPSRALNEDPQELWNLLSLASKTASEWKQMVLNSLSPISALNLEKIYKQLNNPSLLPADWEKLSKQLKANHKHFFGAGLTMKRIQALANSRSHYLKNISSMVKDNPQLVNSIKSPGVVFYFTDRGIRISVLPVEGPGGFFEHVTRGTLERGETQSPFSGEYYQWAEEVLRPIEMLISRFQPSAGIVEIVPGLGLQSLRDTVRQNPLNSTQGCSLILTELLQQIREQTAATKGTSVGLTTKELVYF